MSARRKLPPFARAILDGRSGGLPADHLNVHLMAGPRAWDRARRRAPPHVLALPPGESPESFDWGCAADLEITVQATEEPDEERLARLVVCLLRAGATHLCVLYSDESLVRVAHYRPEILSHAD